MTENENRRGAKRQQRGLQRQAAILEAAAQVFAESGYKDTTTNAIAARAGISPGSLYQFFPNKEAIADALAQHYAAELHAEWDRAFTPETAALPLGSLVDLLIDALLDFNRQKPGFSVLFFGDDITPQLESMGHELHDGMIARFAALIAARNPTLPAEQGQLIANVMMKLYKAFIPGMVNAGSEDHAPLLHEMKAVMRGYLAPYIGG